MQMPLGSPFGRAAQVHRARPRAAIASAADADVLVINPIIYAELPVGIERIEEIDQFLGGTFGAIRFRGGRPSSPERRFWRIAGAGGLRRLRHQTKHFFDRRRYN